MKGYSFMQYLKEEIKSEIMRAALKEFDLNGFEKASMKNIANNAGVAIGNIYRYFKNKEELFNEIIEPAHDKISDLVFDRFQDNNLNIKFNPADIVNSLMKVYLNYSTELMIMMYKSEGTKYQNTKDEMINLVYKRLELEYMAIFSEQGIESIEKFMYIFATILSEGIFTILRRDEDIEEKKKLINQLLIFYFNQLDKRFS